MDSRLLIAIFLITILMYCLSAMVTGQLQISSWPNPILLQFLANVIFWGFVAKWILKIQK